MPLDIKYYSLEYRTFLKLFTDYTEPIDKDSLVRGTLISETEIVRY